MKRIFFLIFIFYSAHSFAQVPEDALRYSWYPQNGTARTLSIGGAMGSLGGDITATFVNPAGLGFYKTNEIVFTPGAILNSNKINYRETANTNSKGGFNLGTSGFVFGMPNNRGKFSSAFSIAITQKASFNNQLNFSGLNNFSSYSEQFAEEFAKSGKSINEILNTNSELPFTAAPALNTFLIDTVTINGRVQVRGAAETILNAGEALKQEYNRNTSGGLYEVGIGGAINDNEHWLVGGTIGVPILNYSSNLTLVERDTSSKTNNGFASSTFNDKFTTNGVGLNLKIGAIYRPAEYIRLGLAVETPSYMALTDERTTSITTKLETPSGNPESFSESSNSYSNGQPGKTEYSQTTPWRAIASASYVFRETENVKKQKGFLTADVEYVNYKGSKFKGGNQASSIYSNSYYTQLNEVIKQEYKGTFNVRAGGELKFNTLMTRLGFAYYGNPYADAALKADMLLLSGGLGYRNKGFFADIAYVYNTTKDVVFPYRLEDRVNTFASLKNNKASITATLGLKF